MFDLPVRAFFPDNTRPVSMSERLGVDAWTDLMAQLGRASVDIAVLDTAEAEVERLCIRALELTLHADIKQLHRE